MNAASAGRSGAAMAARILAATLAMGGALFSGLLQAQAWPAKPVKLIVPYPPGSSVDGFARVVAQKLSDIWKTSVVVEAIAGAGGVVGTQAIAKAPADGYTLGFIAAPHAVNAALYANLPFDPIKDFRPIASLASTSLVFVVRTDFKGSTIADLIVHARANPGKLNFASNGNGSYSHLTTELLGSAAGVKFTHVPYKNIGQLATDLMGGQVDFTASGISTVRSHIQAGRMKALAVTSTKRADLLPGVPTVGETIPGYESKSWMGMVTPAGAPDAVIAKVETDALAAMKDPAVLSAVAAQVLDLDILESAPFARRIENDIRVWKKIVAEVGVKIQ
ncbi:MAG: tripartite tricarboxylate transporter substrate binding protein [Betaproteobacteria bacterium]|nr:tripartite tricarboxylate transporter substrate binding protein [Betaproteobacteria bacterium]